MLGLNLRERVDSQRLVGCCGLALKGSPLAGIKRPEAPCGSSATNVPMRDVARHAHARIELSEPRIAAFDNSIPRAPQLRSTNRVMGGVAQSISARARTGRTSSTQEVARMRDKWRLSSADARITRGVRRGERVSCHGQLGRVSARHSPHLCTATARDRPCAC
jgi:hypothetical protein